MNSTDRKLARLARRQRHLEELQALGYTKNNLAAIKRIETLMHNAAELYANGELTEAGYTAYEKGNIKLVQRLFGGKLPKGFFVNGDPRGYALKLDDEAYSRDPRDPNHMPISYTDWGGYGILAPEDL